jgi:predicted DsbA family dithiol-disulfide isomerase
MLVEIWSDFVCPWCYLGKRRFERVLAAFEHADDVDVLVRSFELDPSAPAGRNVDVTQHLSAKYGIAPAEAERMQQRVTDLAAQEGLEYRLDLARTARTFDAHRLVHLAHAQGLQGDVVEGLMAGYFTQGVRVDDPPTLVRVGVEAGLDADVVADTLAGERYGDAVRHDERLAADLGITAVPFFVVDRRLGVAGAQSAQVLAAMLQQGWERRAA